MDTIALRAVIEQWDDVQRNRARAGEAIELARQALALGHPSLACEILRVTGLDATNGGEARYLAALAHARIGAGGRALAIALAILDDPSAASRHVDALALAGRLAKDRWSRLPDGPQRTLAGKQALDCYRGAWQRSGASFPGINAATMLQLTGHPEDARALAAEVARAAAAERDTAAHWRAATLGECALLQGEAATAITHYRDAVQAAGSRYGDLASMRRQLQLLQAELPVPDELGALLALPAIVVFTGHMLDAPDRAVARFPSTITAQVAHAMQAQLAAVNAGFGYCSAACGGDLLFIEAMLERGAEVHVTLPYLRDDFLATSVSFAGDGWRQRFEHALERATSVRYAVRERFLGDEALHGYSGMLIRGAALMHARELGDRPMMLALLDPASEASPGGTRDLVDDWCRLGLPVTRIDPTPLRAAVVGAPVEPAAVTAVSAPVRASPLRRVPRTMLFADMVGFSRLDEEDTPSFVVHFLGAIAAMLDRSQRRPALVNTWGDGLFIVFDDVVDGAAFALELRDAVQNTDWPAHGLPPGTTIRIGAHTGPVFEALDPLIGRRNAFGSHVVRAARIEPVVTPGDVYVSAEMACALAASGDRGFATDFIGELPLAKGYGQERMYRLRRADQLE